MTPPAPRSRLPAAVLAALAGLLFLPALVMPDTFCFPFLGVLALTAIAHLASFRW